MGIESKHAYRFVFLKSEKWQSLRIARLAKDDAKCCICSKRDLSNDAHHIAYPKNWNETQLFHLRTLCRECHESVHVVMKEKPEVTSWLNIKYEAGTLRGLKMMRGKDYALMHADKMKAARKKLTATLAWIIHYSRFNNRFAQLGV